ncbi:Fanconi anemia group E protein [Quillaja saponaria]|uniref:Fanconi anemia group E protein n=1 Tax=Quillaja saponaria TaxID=32244 RepID=A0AAD7VFG1_QUISA|nr:Fanconi anemia group E protein [Quillaja saponaria]
MESWVPLFEIFLSSPTPETEASQWLQRSFNSSSSSSNTTPLTTASFLSMLMKPSNAIVVNSSPASPLSPTLTKRVMFIQTLPAMVQSRIISFLALDRQRFCSQELIRLARNVLSWDQDIDFWVKKAAHNLLDAVSETNYQWISSLHLDFAEESMDEEFESVPRWLVNVASSHDVFLPWLPVSPDELMISKTLFGTSENSVDSLSQLEVDKREDKHEIVEETEIGHSTNVPLEREIIEKAICLKTQIRSFESTSRTVGLANEIRQLCLSEAGDSFAALGLIEPWLADDETTSLLIYHLDSGNEEELNWPSQVLCSIILPKFLVLEEPASRVLVSATIDYCKLHQRPSEYALMLPLVFRREGINNYICDFITRVIRECLHPAHVSAFCQKMLCGGKDERKLIYLPCHQSMISDELVQHLVEFFSKSLKFGNFLLCLVTKCTALLKSHKLPLTKAVQQSDTVVTKSILSKLSSM